jgi:hypothetical protein
MRARKYIRVSTLRVTPAKLSLAHDVPENDIILSWPILERRSVARSRTAKRISYGKYDLGTPMVAAAVGLLSMVCQWKREAGSPADDRAGYECAVIQVQ